MVDDNFRLQLRHQLSDLQQDPSMFGDSGFFAKVDTFNNFVEYAEKLELKEKEKKKQKKANFDLVSSKVFCQLALINYRITAHYEQGML
jgi:hypothetical protein